MSASKRLATILLGIFILSFAASAASLVSGADRGPAIGGYDAVAYFTDGKPVKGDGHFTSDWHGATWWFASAEHRDRFAAAPEKYAPQYGGYCAFATAHGRVAEGDAERWKIVGDKLYLNNNWFAHTLWRFDENGNIDDSERKWPAVQNKIEQKTVEAKP